MRAYGCSPLTGPTNALHKVGGGAPPSKVPMIMVDAHAQNTH